MSLRLINETELADMLGRTEDAVDATTLAQAREIVEDVRNDSPKDAAFIRHAIRLKDLSDATQPYTVSKNDLKVAYDQLPANERAALGRMCERIKTFATAQRSAIQDIDIPIPGGRAGHRVQPVRTAGCYAPGGRYPLPSSVLMTAVTARVAGVTNVWVASPNPAPVSSPMGTTTPPQPQTNRTTLPHTTTDHAVRCVLCSLYFFSLILRPHWRQHIWPAWMDSFVWVVPKQ